MLKDSLRSVNILLEKHYRKSFRKGINRGEHARKNRNCAFKYNSFYTWRGASFSDRVWFRFYLQKGKNMNSSFKPLSFTEINKAAMSLPMPTRLPLRREWIEERMLNLIDEIRYHIRIGNVSQAGSVEHLIDELKVNFIEWNS